MYFLTDEEKFDVYKTVEAMLPDDKNAQAEAAKFRGACVLLKKIFGGQWYKNNIERYAQEKKTFLRRDLSVEEERYLYVVRVIQLAEALYTLRDTPGICLRVDDNRSNTLESVSLESTWFEFFVPYLIKENGSKIVEFLPPEKSEKTPDLIIEFGNTPIPVEIKTKLEDITYSRRTLRRSISRACDQLPGSGPGIVFLMVHLHWLEDPSFLREAEGVINRALQNHRNCNVVFVFWPLIHRLTITDFAYTWRFQHFVATSPADRINHIEELIIKRTMPKPPYQSIQVTFLDGEKSL